MNEKSKTTRREFLKKSTTAAAGLGLAATAVPSVGVLGANETIVLGVIGTGGRGQWFLKEARKQGATIGAVCDVYTERLRKAAVIAGGEPYTTDEHKKVLDRKDIDGVCIATPDHWHHDMLIDAVNAGKDVYIEKPFSKTIEEGKEMVKAVRATDRVVQVGNHRRSGAHWDRARKLIASGALGKVNWVRVFDTRDWTRGDPFAPPAQIEGEIDWKKFVGPAPWHEFDPYRYFAWRWYWDYAGGLMTDIGAHQLDIAQWLMGVDGPKSVAANGGNYFLPKWETPDVVHSVLDYGTFSAVFSVEFLNAYDGVGGTFYGTEGTLVADDVTFKVYSREDRQNPVEQWPAEYEGPAHVANFLDCMKTRKEPNSPVEVGHRVITAAHLGNISYRSGKRVLWDVEREQMM
jgi:predicted dehydrogenase